MGWRVALYGFFGVCIIGGAFAITLDLIGSIAFGPLLLVMEGLSVPAGLAILLGLLEKDFKQFLLVLIPSFTIAATLYFLYNRRIELSIITSHWIMVLLTTCAMATGFWCLLRTRWHEQFELPLYQRFESY